QGPGERRDPVGSQCRSAQVRQKTKVLARSQCGQCFVSYLLPVRRTVALSYFLTSWLARLLGRRLERGLTKNLVRIQRCQHVFVLEFPPARLFRRNRRQKVRSVPLGVHGA